MLQGYVGFPLDNSLHLKMDGWNTFSFPFGFRPIFRGELLVSGSVEFLFSRRYISYYLSSERNLPVTT